MDAPILRATDAGGDVYDDPSEDALYMFMQDLTSPGSSLRVDRVEPGREESVVVSLKGSGLYELKGGNNIIYVSSLRSVHEFLARWAFDLFPADDA